MSYPQTTAPPPRSALLSGLRGQTPPSGGRPSPNGNHSGAGYPRLPPHTPQHRQRFPSSEHTLGPSFDDDDEDEEMVAKMAALNAGVYPYQGPQRNQGPGGGGGPMSQMAPRGPIDRSIDPGGHRIPEHRMSGPIGQSARRLGMGGGDANHPSSINYQQHQQQQQQQHQQVQQQELLRMLTMQTLASNQGPRNMEELQLLQALAQQQQQREMEQQVEQLLRMQVQQQAQQLQQQLIAQQHQAAMLAAQPNRNQQGPSSASFNQRSFDQSYAHAQQQVQLANQAQRVQQTPQQLASAYEQRHQAQQQIQANLRARSGVPALPTPAAVAASGHRFGFELDPPRDDVHGAGIFGNGTGAGLGARPVSQPRGLSPQPGAGAVGERSQASPGTGSRVSSPLETSAFGGLPLPASQAGQRDATFNADFDQRDVPSLGGQASVWTAGKSDTSGNWRTKATESPPPAHPRSVSAGVTSPPVSRFSGTFSPPPPHAREASAPIARFQANNGLDHDGRSESSSHPSRPNSNSDENEGSRSPTSSEGLQNQNQTQINTRWNASGPDVLKPIFEGIGLGRPYPNQQQPQDNKSSSPTPPSTGGYGGARSLSMAAAAAALNSQSLEDAHYQQQSQRATPPIADNHPRSRSGAYDLGGGAGNGNSAAFGSNVIRQPRGPPSPADELGARNFASRMRKKAGSNLSLLGRREASPAA